MDYKQVTIVISEQEQKEIVVALLEDISYEGFEEQDEQVVAFIPEADYNEADLKNVLEPINLSFTVETIEQQNWNAQWESNFEPVIVEGFCTVRAGFHDMEITTPYEIVITPKMSFGTGHHATTMLMMEQMSGMELSGKKVLDFGTGTGILAILGRMLGAVEIDAIDNDEWSYENALENVTNNDSTLIKVTQGSLEAAGGEYDVILANINRHILLEYMSEMCQKLKEGGTILMSGILLEDREIIVKAAESVGFALLNEKERKNWLTLLFKK